MADNTSEWAREIELYAHALAAVIQRTTAEPAPGSYIATEGAEATPLAAGRVRMLAAGDHLLGIAGLLDDSPIPRMAPFTLLRTVLESAAVAAWLWEPGLSAAARGKRGDQARGTNLSEVFKMYGDPETKMRWDAIGNATLPGAIAILQLLLPSKAAHRLPQGEWLYRQLSGRGHGEMWSTISGELVGPADATSSYVKLEFDPQKFRDDAVQGFVLVDQAAKSYGNLGGVASEAWFTVTRPALR